MTDLITKNDIELIEHKEPRIDSRLVAKEMGIRHKNLYALITKHKKALREFGSLPFETETKKRTKGGTYLKFVLLNENQFDLISRLVRGKNYEQIIDFKVRVTKAFAASRKREAVKRESLAYYHESRNSLSTMQGVKDYHYINLARAENKFIGLCSGERKKADEQQLGALIIIQKIEAAVFSEINSPTEAVREVGRPINALADLISSNQKIGA